MAGASGYPICDESLAGAGTSGAGGSFSSLDGRKGVRPIHGSMRRLTSQSLAVGIQPRSSFDVLLTHKADGNLTAGGVSEGDAEQSLAEEDSLRVMSKGSMAKVRHKGLGFVEPVVDWEIILSTPAKEFGGTNCVMPA